VWASGLCSPRNVSHKYEFLGPFVYCCGSSSHDHYVLMCTNSIPNSSKLNVKLFLWKPQRRVGNWSIAPIIFNFGTRWGRLARFTPRPHYRRWKCCWFLLNGGLPRFQGWSEFFGEERNLFLCGESNHEPQFVQPVA